MARPPTSQPSVNVPNPAATSSHGAAHTSGLQNLAQSSRWLDRPIPTLDQPPTWLLLLICLLASLPALLVEIPRPDVGDPLEAQALAISIHTWDQLPRRGSHAGLSLSDLFLPFYNGQPRVYEPPGLTWTHLLAFQISKRIHGRLPLEHMILAARIVSVIFGLLTIGAVFWAGRSIGDNRTAMFAALVYAANMMFVYSAHIAAPPVAHTAWALLSVAAALWAIRPLKPRPSLARQAIGWGLCGLFLAGALLVAGPVALLTVAAPVFLILVLCPGRLNHLLGLLASLLIGVVLVLPWAAAVHEHDPETWRRWLLELTSQAVAFSRLPAVISDRLWLLLRLLMPWPLWLIGALSQPFSTSSKGSRTRLFLGWVWFASLALLLLFLPAGNDYGTLLPVLPAAAVLIGQLFRQYVDLASAGRYPRYWRWLRWPHLGLLAVASVGVPVVLWLQPQLDHPFALTLPWWGAAIMALCLLALTYLSLRWLRQEAPGKTLVSWAAWTLVVITICAFPVARGPWARNPIRPFAQKIAILTGAQPLYWLKTAGSPAAPDPALVLYTGRNILPITPAQFAQAYKNHATFYLLSPSPPPESALAAASCRSVLPAPDLALYVCTSLTSATPTAPAATNP